MGNCIEKGPFGAHSFISSYSRISWASDGYFNESSLEIPIDLYQDLQDSYNLHWRSYPKSEKSLKYLISKGVPQKLIKRVLQSLYPQASLPILISSPLPSATPTFSPHLNLNSAIPKFYLNSPGIKALSKILWTLNNSFHNLYYSPTLTVMLSLMLIHTSEVRCYEIIEAALRYSESQKDLISKIVYMDAEQFRNVVAVVCRLAFEQIEGLMVFVQARKIELVEVVAEMIKVFFVGFFKLPFLQRALIWVLAEGLSALVRICIGVLKVISHDFSEFKAEFLDDLITNCYSFDNDSEVFNAAVKTKITKNVMVDLIVPQLKGLSSFKFTRLVYAFESSCATALELEVIWANVPEIFKNCSLEMFFSTKNDGFSLSALLRKAEELKRCDATMFLIKTQSQNVIGAFVDCRLKAEAGYTGSTNCFVFVVRPEINIYHSSGVNDMYSFISNAIIIFGGGKLGAAITIDKELLHCTSSTCETFNNPILLEDAFDLVDLEIIILH